MPYSAPIEQVIDILLSHGLDKSIMNNSKKMAVDMIPTRNDKRHRIIGRHESCVSTNLSRKRRHVQIPSSSETHSTRRTGTVKARKGKEIAQLPGEVSEERSTLVSQLTEIIDGLPQEDYEGWLQKTALNAQSKAKHGDIEGQGNEQQGYQQNPQEQHHEQQQYQEQQQLQKAEKSQESNLCQTRQQLTTKETCRQLHAPATDAQSQSRDGSFMLSQRRYSALQDEQPEHSEGNTTETEFTSIKKYPWEVRCTAEFWKLLRNPKKNRGLTRNIMSKIHMIANGEWRHDLCRQMEGTPGNCVLFESNVTESVRLLWERSKAFSPRLSTTVNKGSSFSDGHVYTEVIRIWDVVFNHDQLTRRKNKIVQSHKRGQDAVHRLLLSGTDEAIESTESRMTHEQLPRKFFLTPHGRSQKNQRTEILSPPASPLETEYNIVKFYPLTNDMVTSCLDLTEHVAIDFRFDINAEEYDIIYCKDRSSILLLGRSGTGKTTCCLYRMWLHFKKYWKKTTYDNPWFTCAFSREANEIGPKCLDDSQLSGVDSRAGDEAAQNKSVVLLDSNAGYPGIESIPSSILPPLTERQSEDEQKYHQPFSHVEAKNKQSGDALVEPTVTVHQPSDVSGASVTGPQYVHLQQVFVAKNRALCDKMRENFLKLSRGSKASINHRQYENMVLPHRLQDVHAMQFPLFLTSRQWLLLLDASLPISTAFFSRDSEGSLQENVNTWDDVEGRLPSELQEAIEDSDEESSSDSEDDERRDSDSELSDDDLLDISSQISQASQGVEKTRLEVTYNFFQREMWPDIRKASSDGEKCSYHPSLVWTEIKSFIKGTLEAVSSQNGFLSREEYEILGRKKAPNFEGNREEIYSMFERYEKLKRQKRAYDECDLVQNLYHRIQSEQKTEWVVNEIYVDETQDFTQAEIALFIRSSSDPNALFFTGDTAQGIMRGVSFRFTDIRSLFHHVKEEQPTFSKIVVPKVQPLNENYRSHSGILKLASSVVKLMKEFFPETFDILPEDRGLFEGPKPSLLTVTGDEDLALLLRGNRRKTSPIEFGAKQVILVRSQEVVDKMPEGLKTGMVMTIFEAKGLEFDDVLLYNFSSDSKIQDEWRVIYSYMQKQTELASSLTRQDETRTSHRRPLKFESSKHRLLSSELKHLYTAITRARVNVWIFDENESRRAPLFDYFVASQLVSIVDQGALDEGIGAYSFAKGSSAKDWTKQGHYFSKHRKWRLAAKCYSKAGNFRRESRCLALHCFDEAESSFDKQKKTNLMAQAAFHCLRCGKIREAGELLQKGRHTLLAARVFRKCREPLRAAQIYAKLCKPDQAVQCWIEGLDFNKACNYLFDREDYEGVVKVLQESKKRTLVLNTDDCLRCKIQWPSEKYKVEKLLKKAASIYIGKNDFESMSRTIDKLPLEDKIDFYKTYNFTGEVVRVYRQEGLLNEAREALFATGDFPEAAVCAQDDPAFQGECYLILAEKELAKKRAGNLPEEFRTTAMEPAKAALEAYERAEDKFGQGLCYYVFGEIKQSTDDFQTARSIFQQIGCVCGDVESTFKRLSLCFDSLSDCKAAEYLVGQVAKLYCYFCCPAKSYERQQIEKCYRFYNLRELDVNSYGIFKIYLASPCRGLEWCDAPIQSDTQGSMYEINKKTVCRTIEEHLLTLLKATVVKTRSYFQDRLTSSKLCRQWFIGIDCELQSRCRKRHEQISSKVLTDHVLCIDTAMLFEEAVKQALGLIDKLCHKHPSFDRIVAKVAKDVRQASLKLASFLIDVLCPSEGKLSLKWLTLDLAIALQQMKSRNLIHSQLLKLWRDNQDTVRRGDINFTQRMWSLFQVFPDKTGNNIYSRLIQEEQNGLNFALQKWPREKAEPHLFKIAAIPAHDTYELYVRWWLDAKNLFYSGNLLGASSVMLRQLLTRSMKCTGCERPTLSETLAMLEMETTVLLSLAVRLQPKMKIRACVPSSYVQALQFWSQVVQKDNNYHVNAIGKLSDIRGALRDTRWLLKYIVNLLLGGVSKRFYILRFALTRKQNVQSGGAERCLILAITLMLNAATSFTVPSNMESQIYQSITTALLDRTPWKGGNVILPPRITNAIRDVARYATASDLGRSFVKLIAEGGDSLATIVLNEEGKICYRDAKIDEFDERPLIQSSSLPAPQDVASSYEGQQEDKYPDIGLDSEVYEHRSTEEVLLLEQQEKDRRIKELREKNARRKIGKFLLQILDRKRQQNARIGLEEEDTTEEPLDRFDNFVIDDTGCQICGKSFVQAIRDSSSRAAELTSSDECLLRKAHEDDQSHRAALRHFEQYKDFFNRTVQPTLTSASDMLTVLRNPEEEQRRKQLSHEFAELDSSAREVRRLCTATEGQRKWDDGLTDIKEELNKLDNRLKHLNSLYRQLNERETTSDLVQAANDETMLESSSQGGEQETDEYMAKIAKDLRKEEELQHDGQSRERYSRSHRKKKTKRKRDKRSKRS